MDIPEGADVQILMLIFKMDLKNYELLHEFTFDGYILIYSTNIPITNFVVAL